MTIGYYYARGRVDGFLCRHQVVRTRELHLLGLRNADIDTFVRRGRLVRIARGIYRSNQFSESPDQIVAAAALRIPKGVLCLASAAYIHSLFGERPPHVWLAVPSKTWPPKVPELPVRIWYASPAAGSLPIEEREVAGVPVRVYSEVATVAHLVARRAYVGEDVAGRALRVLLHVEPTAKEALLEAATVCRARRAMEDLMRRAY